MRGQLMLHTDDSCWRATVFMRTVRHDIPVHEETNWES